MKLWRYGHDIEVLGQRYRLQQPLGSGGMADVCLAWDEQEAHFVAIKVIKSDNLDQKSLDRFLKEIAQIIRLDHPHILRVYSSLNLELLDVAHGSIVPYIVMEYAQGGDLQRRMRTDLPYDFDEMLHIFRQMAEAVQYAHEQGVIHRDIKPHNILFRRVPGGSEQAVLSDFGLAVEISATHHTFASGGTLAYMAPEQFRGQAQAASDIFSLGVVLYQLCTGTLPFQRSLADIARIASPEPPALARTLNARVPPALDDAILFALASDPAQRPASAALLLELVQDAVRSAPPVSHLSTPSSGGLARLGGWHAPRPGITSPMPTSSSFGGNASPAAPAFTRDLNAVTDPALGSPGDAHPSPPSTHTSHTSLTRSQHNIIQLPSAPGRVDVSRPSVSRQSTPSRPRASVSSHSSHLSTPATPPVVAPPITPTRRSTPPGRGGVAPQPGGWLKLRRYGWLVALLAIVAIIAIPLTILSGHGAPAAASTTITITPASQTLSATYPLTAVTRTPNATEIQARSLTASAQSSPQTVPATGQAQTQGTRAGGNLTFLNGSFAPYTINTTTPISGSSGTVVYLDTATTIPAGDANTGKLGTVTVNAHAANTGSAGNIAALDINKYCCTTNGNYIYVKNVAAFTGGVDPQSYTVVAQDDISRASEALTAGAKSAAQQKVGGMVRAGETVAGAATCTPQVQMNYQAGAKATTVTVQVTVSCTALAYEVAQIAPLLTPTLVQQAQTQMGAAFASSALVDSQGKRTDVITLTNIDVTSVDTVGGTIALTVHVSGTWTHQFSAAQLSHMKALVAGKTVAQAQDILAGLAGVAMVAIRPDAGTLPGDAGQFAMVVKA